MLNAALENGPIKRVCVCTFFHAYGGLVFTGLRSDSVALCHVVQGLPGGCLQIGGACS